MNPWNIPHQESLGSLKQHRQTCTNMLLCLWRGKALMEIIGLLGSDISKCAICFPSLPSAMIFDAIPTPSLRVVCDKNPSLANFLPISLFFFFLSFCLSLLHVEQVSKVLICYHSDFAMLVHTEVTEQGNCETTAPKSDIHAKINMVACRFHLRSCEIMLILIFTPFPFWNF